MTTTQQRVCSRMMEDLSVVDLVRDPEFGAMVETLMNSPSIMVLAYKARTTNLEKTMRRHTAMSFAAGILMGLRIASEPKEFVN